MKTTVEGLNITYPDLGFAFNPIRIFINGFVESGYIAIKTNNMSIEHEVGPTSKKISFDLSAVAQSLFDRLDFHNIEEHDTTLFKTIDFEVYNKRGSESIHKGSIPVIWGALQIGERYTQNKTLTYFRGYPFTLPLYLDNTASLYVSLDKGDICNIGSFNRGKYNITLPHSDARESIIITSTTTTYSKIFDYTFDFTFGPQRIEKAGDLNIEIKIANCVTGDVYLRWINKYGEYNYYLFQSSNKTSTIKNSDIKFNNVYHTTDFTSGYHQGTGKNVGKNIEQSLKLFAHLVDSETVDFLQALVESPVVDMFLGYSQDNSEKWISVDIQEGTFSKSTAVLQDFEFNLIPNNKIVQTL